jgi:hypothetical protein
MARGRYAGATLAPLLLGTNERLPDENERVPDENERVPDENERVPDENERLLELDDLPDDEEAEERLLATSIGAVAAALVAPDITPRGIAMPIDALSNTPAPAAHTIL